MKQLVLASIAVAAILASAPAHAQSKKPTLSRASAEKIALAQQPGKIKSGELEKEYGRMIYSFDIQTQSGIHEVNVDANTGKIVEDSVESPDAEAKEKQQESANPK